MLCEKTYLVRLKSLDVAITQENKRVAVKVEDVLSRLDLCQRVVDQIFSDVFKLVNVL